METFTRKQLKEIDNLAAKLATENSEKGLNKGLNLALKEMGINKEDYISFCIHIAYWESDAQIDLVYF